MASATLSSALVGMGCLMLTLPGCVSLWLARALRKRGVLTPRKSQEHMRGKREALCGGPVESHYAVFSSDGEWGRGKIDPSKPLVLHIHGLAATLDQLTWGVDGGLARALVHSGYTVLALDLLGHGFSDAPDTPLAPDEFVSQVEALVEHLGISGSFDLIGFSHGSFVAANYASRHPDKVRRLILTSPWGCDLPLNHWRLIAGVATLIVQLTFEGNMSHTRTIFRVVSHLEGRKLPSILKTLDSAPFKLLVIAGSYDCDPALGILQTARRIHKSVRKSNLHVLKRGMHMSWAHGDPELQREFRNVLVDFLQEQEVHDRFDPAGVEASLLGTLAKDRV